MTGRRLLALAAAALATVGVVVLPVSGDAPTVVAEAADTRQFRAGNIITDQLFFDGGAMSAAEVQSFLNVRNPNCVAGADGTPCLKNYRVSTPTMPADVQRCPGTYTGGTNETAATIIAKVGQACGISQRVLLVMLQKEQGLVTGSGSGLYARRYREAMGYACPDTATCNPAYAGFFKQVHTAAGRFKYYAANPTAFNHRAGRVNQVRYDVEIDCGSSAVDILNQATAGLYNYTPYQPNAAALAAGKGTGDRCSAYGNRNFWIFFTDWFGSTQTAGAGDLADRYVASGGEAGALGAVTGAVTCGLRDGGCFQAYARGAIYWSAATGAKIVFSSPVRDKWQSLSWERGALGYPTGDVSRTPDGQGWFGHFQGGSIYWSSASGAHTLSGAIRDRWAAMGWQTSSLGYPAADQGVTPDGRAQYVHFQNGSLYWSPTTGARVVRGAVKDAWAAAGWERGWLGLPVGDVGPTGDGRAQFAHFEGGSVYVVDGTTRLLPSSVVEAWRRTGWEYGELGYPTSGVVPSAGGAGEQMSFERGAVFITGAGEGYALYGPVEAAFAAAGGVPGELGAPTSDPGVTPDGRAQFAHFEGGSIYVVDGTARLLPAAIVGAWRSAGWERGALGHPVSDVSTVTGGEVMFFEGGSVHVSAAGVASVLDGAVEDAFVAAGGAGGTLGFPAGSVRTTPDGVGRYAHFQRGSIYWTQATGARVIAGPVRDRWAATGWERGLGYPTTSVVALADGRGQFAHFQGGSIYWTAETGARTVSGPVRDRWAATGWERGLGYPTTSVTVTPDGRGRYAHFERGSIYWTAETGARTVSGPVRAAWAARGWERGLGYPTTSVTTTPDGVGQYAHFQKGSIYFTPSTGARSLSVPFRNAWAGTGWERGSLGYPTSDAYAVSGGTRMNFQRGSITISSSTGRATVRVN